MSMNSKPRDSSVKTTQLELLDADVCYINGLWNDDEVSGIFHQLEKLPDWER